MLTIAIDAMGGDFGPEPIIEGTIQALLEEKQFHAILVGKSEEIRHMIPGNLQNRVTYVEADDVFDMHESATDAFKRKETTIYKAVDLVRKKVADGVVSAGHSGATMGLSTLRIGRLKGVARPAIATLMPTLKGDYTLVLDVGANVDCKPEHLFQFAIMGEAYVKDILGIKRPKIGLLSNGEEATKGNEITKEAYEHLSKLDAFIGNVEGSDIFNNSVNVVVCDGFVGNVVLKTSEGVADSITKIIKQNIKRSPVAIAGAVLMKKVFKILKKQVDYAEYGGAPLIGINGCAIVSHGKSNAKAIKNAIFQAISFAGSNINEDIESELARFSK